MVRPSSGTEETVLAVDLDGTLVRSDLLYETFWELASRNVWAALAAIFRLRAGRAAFKAALAERARIDPAALPYNEDVLAHVRDWRARGGRAILVTASDRSVAEAIAAHLGCFDEVHGSDGTTNLKGPAKADFLAARHGPGGFDYMGDARADLPVWKQARRAITVDAPADLRRAAENAGAEEVVHLGQPRGAGAYFRALRPHQWSKNVLVLLAPIAGHVTDPAAWGAVLAAFVAFSLTASGVYVLNDLLDLAADRAHPRKRYRPLASGALPILHGSLMAPALFGLGLLVALAFTPGLFVAVLAGYLALTMAYSLTLKRKLLVDICTLAGLYTVRIVAGGVAAGIPLSVWLLAFSIFLFFSLAAIKRQAELVDSLKRDKLGASGRGYHVDDLSIVSMMAVSSGYVSTLVMALYLNSPAVTELYSFPVVLWGICPVLLYWISRMAMMAHRGYMHDDPIVFAMKDGISRACAVLLIAIGVGGSVL